MSESVRAWWRDSVMFSRLWRCVTASRPITASIDAAASATASVSVVEPWSYTSSARLPTDRTIGTVMPGTSSVAPASRRAGCQAARLMISAPTIQPRSSGVPVAYVPFATW